MKRLNQDRQNKLQPIRMDFAKTKISALGYTIESDDTKLWFTSKGERVTYFPYSGWASGKSIQDGRGIYKLLEQIQNI